MATKSATRRATSKKKPQRAAGPPAPTPAAAGGLVIRRVSIDALHPDPNNARLHGEQNRQAIRTSLERFGQVEPLVVQKGTGKVIGGNGRLSVMIEMGMTEVDVVEVDFQGHHAAALGIVLNRSSELGEWNLAELQRQVEGLEIHGLTDLSLDALGFTDDQFDALEKGNVKKAHGFAPVEKGLPKEPTATAEYKIIIDCKDEAEQREKIDKLLELGWEFTAPGMAAVE